jgi:hypothetical protein
MNIDTLDTKIFMNLNKYTEGSNRTEDSTMEDLDVVSLPCHRKLQMELGLHVARFLKKSKITLLSFKKFGTKNLDVDNYEIYYCAKN